MILITGATGNVGRHLVSGLPRRIAADLPTKGVDDGLERQAGTITTGPGL